MKQLRMMRLLVVSFFIAFPGGLLRANDFNREIFEKTLEAIKKSSFHKLSDSEIYQGALQGVLNTLEKKNGIHGKEEGFGSSANILLSPDRAEGLKKDIEGEITGIGVVLKLEREKGEVFPLITKVIAGGGAQSADFKKGDRIMKIDGTSVGQFNDFNSIVYKIRGKKDSKVKLTILRGSEVINKKVSRTIIKYDTVEYQTFPDNIGYFKMVSFAKTTYDQFRQALAKMKKEKVKSVIIDLRANWGGPLDEGIRVLDLFASKGDVILKKVMAPDNREVEIKAEYDKEWDDIRTVILVDKHTRSMGEGFARSLQLLTNGIIIGQKTYGKASIETVMEMGNGHSVKFTVGLLADAKGDSWQGKGILPDIEVPDLSSDTTREIEGQDHILELAKKFLVK